jgi:hypothetical protein
MSRTIREGPSEERPDDDCVVCGDPADGIDAGRDGNAPVCRRCVRIRFDGGVVESAKYHAVRSDCTFEELEDDQHRAAQAVDEHESDEPPHAVHFEEVTER